MADLDFDFEPPSFSLGLDLDLQSEPQPASRSDPLFQPAERPSASSNLCTIEEDDDEDFESPVRVSNPPRGLKRLRRGTTARVASEVEKAGTEGGQCNVDEEIEDFSSEEDWPRGTLPTNSVCSSSKPSLHRQRVVNSESGNRWKPKKGKELSASTSANMETKGSNKLFPKLTVSPLRRFQLIDSDSDDPPGIEDASKEVSHVTLSPKKNQSDSSKHAALSELGTQKASVSTYQNDDLWKNFRSVKSSHIPTPAFDEICEEYFTNVKNKSKTGIDHKVPFDGREPDVASLPPAHSYFFHKDLRIQKLVRDCLPYFFPLGAGNNQEYRLQNASGIDYMGQFGHEENSRSTDRRQNIGKSSRGNKRNVNTPQVENVPQRNKRNVNTPQVENVPQRNKRNVSTPQVENIPQESENWVNPKHCAELPKNAGNRRVQAVGKSAGHWYTNPNGQRVYVNANGQELTGRIAYSLYRKESGKGFKKSKKKAAAKKKSAAKKKYAPKKK